MLARPRILAGRSYREGDVEHGNDLDKFIVRFAKASAGKVSALGFEAPMFIPHGRPLQKLTSQRNGDNGKPWSAGAGATVTTIGLAIVSHALAGLREQGCTQCATLDWQAWPNNDDLLLFEAFVSGANHAGPGEHWNDALNAAQGFVAALSNLDAANAVFRNQCAVPDRCLHDAHRVGGNG